MRVLCVDPGEKNIGLALSDPTGTIASPLTVIKHVARAADAEKITQLAIEHEASLIVVGQALNDEGEPTQESRKASRLAEAIRRQSGLTVRLWDESGSTQAARMARLAMGAPRAKRRGHLDELAATYILQTYLDAHSSDSLSMNSNQ